MLSLRPPILYVISSPCIREFLELTLEFLYFVNYVWVFCRQKHRWPSIFSENRSKGVRRNLVTVQENASTYLANQFSRPCTERVYLQGWCEKKEGQVQTRLTTIRIDNCYYIMYWFTQIYIINFFVLI